jgi:uncharacterized protein YdeI (YjbR/CyaY-like superfamily)
MSNSRVDEYAAGLERWGDEFAALRTILVDTGLTEEFKWYKPQRGYLLHFNGAKQSATRAARIARVQDRIMEGFGLYD